MKVKLKELDKAFHKTRHEIYSLGLLTPGLDSVECILSPLPSIFGEQAYFVEETSLGMRLAGFSAGHIYFPSLISKASLRHVMRHEFGHAWAWHHPGIFRSRCFKSAFEESYFSNIEWVGPFDKNHFISEYAMTSPAEDFAETFATFLKYKNSLSKFKRRIGVYKKLMTVKRLIQIQSAVNS